MLKKQELLIIIDMQNSFLQTNGALYIQNANNLIQLTNTYLKENMCNFDSILYTLDTHFKDTYQLQRESQTFPEHCIYNTPDWDLALDMNIINQFNKPIYEMQKDKYDMWGQKDPCNKHHDTLFALLNHVNKQVIYNSINDFIEKYNSQNTNITILGVASDYCCQMAIEGFAKRGYEIKILKNLMEGINLSIEKVIANMGVQYYNTKNIIYINH